MEMRADPVKDHPTIPDHVPADLVIDFDIRTDGVFQGDPQAGLHSLKERGKVLFSPRNGGHWVVTDGAAVTEVFCDTNRFSANTPLDGSTEQPVVIPMGVDPPEHHKYRRLIDVLLTPRQAKAMHDEIRALAIELIEQVRDRGKCEFLSEVAEPYPVTIFLRLANLPLDRLGDFRQWSKVMLHSQDPVARNEALMTISQYLLGEVEQRRASPGDDLFSALSRARVDDRPLTSEELLSMVFTIFIGGLDTVLNALTFIMNFLARNPGHRQTLINDPSRIPDALEEMMRRFSMVSLFRKATQETELKGVHIKAGDRIWASTVMIGVDDDLVSNPLEVNFDRTNVRNSIFGVGPHHCPGRHLARQELRIFLEEWLRRVPQFSIADNAEMTVLTGTSMGFSSLPLVWQTLPQANL